MQELYTLVTEVPVNNTERFWAEKSSAEMVERKWCGFSKQYSLSSWDYFPGAFKTSRRIIGVKGCPFFIFEPLPKLQRTIQVGEDASYKPIIVNQA